MNFSDRRRVRWSMTIPALLFGVWVTPVEGYGHEIIAGRLTVGHPWAEPAPGGASTRLHLTISNATNSSAVLMGVTTPVATRSAITIDGGAGMLRTLKSITVPAGESLNLSTSHMWISLWDLKQSLRIGEEFHASVKFGDDRELPIVVTVDEPPRRPSHHRVPAED